VLQGTWIDIRKLIYPAHLIDTVEIFIKEAIVIFMESNVEVSFHRVELPELILHSLRKLDWLAASLSLKSELSNSVYEPFAWRFDQTNVYATI
jgi:hypothetical protein